MGWVRTCRGIARAPHFVAIWLAVATLLRLIWVLAVDPQPMFDPAWYYEAGQRIAEGHGYSNQGIPTSYWPVGYPAFLGGLFWLFPGSILAAKLAQLVLSVASIFLAYRITGTLFRSKAAGRIVLVLLALHVNQIANCSLLFSEPLYLFLTLLGFIALLGQDRRLGRGAAAGIIFGLASLTRPLALLLPAIYMAWRLISKQSDWRARTVLMQTLISYCCLFAVLAPWTIRNYRVFGEVILVSTNGGPNLLVGNNPFANGEYYMDARVAALYECDGNEYERGRNAWRVALDYIESNPLHFMRLIPNKLKGLYLKDFNGVVSSKIGMQGPVEKARFSKRSPGESSASYWGWIGLALLAQGYYMALLGMFLLSIVALYMRKRNGRGPRPPTLGLWILLYFTCVHLIFFGTSRYHLPLMPWLCMYIGAFVAGTLERERDHAPLLLRERPARQA